MDLKQLAEPFPAKDIEWRIQSSGKKGDKIWAMCLAYVTNRAIMNRLDEVCGPQSWKNRFAPGPLGGVICGLSVKVGDEWIEKWDGADETDIEKIKGGLSSSMKRAGVQWGIGRYLYDLDAGWAVISDKGEFSAKTKDGTWFKWSAPALPAWALPAGAKDASGGRAAEPMCESDDHTLLKMVKAEFSKIDNLVHLANHWKKHATAYRADPDFAKITEAKDTRKAELSKALDMAFLEEAVSAISGSESLEALETWLAANEKRIGLSSHAKGILEEAASAKARFA